MIDIKHYGIIHPIHLHSQTYVYPLYRLHLLADVLVDPVGVGLLIEASPAVGMLNCLQVIDHPNCKLASTPGLVIGEGDFEVEEAEAGEVLSEEQLELAVVLPVSSVLAEWGKYDLSAKRV